MSRRDAIDLYAQWLGVPLDARPPDHYRLLGLEPLESDEGLIEKGWTARSVGLRDRPFEPRYASAVDELLDDLAHARAVLTDRKRKAAYDRLLTASGDVASPEPIPAESIVDLSPFVAGDPGQIESLARSLPPGRSPVRTPCARCGFRNTVARIVCRRCGSPAGEGVAAGAAPSGGRSYGALVAGAIGLLAVAVGLPVWLATRGDPGASRGGSSDAGDGLSGSGQPVGPRPEPGALAKRLAFVRERWKDALAAKPEAWPIEGLPKVSAIAIASPCASVLAEDGTLLVWGRQQPLRKSSIPALAGGTVFLRLGNGGRAYAAVPGGHIHEWSGDGIRDLGVVADSRSPRPIVSVRGSDDLLFLTEGPSRLRLWRLHAQDIPLPEGAVPRAAAWSESAVRAAVFLASGELLLGRPEALRPEPPTLSTTAAVDLVLDVDGRCVALLREGASARLRWTGLQDVVDVPAVLSDGPPAYWIGPDSEGVLVAASRGRRVELWLASAGELGRIGEVSFGQGAPIRALEVDPIRAILAALFEDGTVLVLDPARLTQPPPAPVEGPSPAEKAAQLALVEALRTRIEAGQFREAVDLVGGHPELASSAQAVALASRAYLEVVRSRSTSGDLAGARELVDAGRAFAPRDVGLAEAQARVSAAQGRDEDALASWAEASSFAPEDAGLARAHAMALSRLGRPAEALPILERLAGRSPDDAPLAALAAATALAAGDSGAARRHAERAMELGYPLPESLLSRIPKEE